MMGLTTSVYLILVLVSQFGLMIQTCNECTCCKGSHVCDSNRNCVDGCIDGYYGAKCTGECLKNCKTCANGNECTECKPGYYDYKCNLQCGKGCVNKTCGVLSGECQCKSPNFVKGKCDACLDLKYGDECNYTCPTNCGICTSDTECRWCKNTAFYGSYCQYRCSAGCLSGRCYKSNGHCTDGCKPSFAGVKCDLCSPGYFGTYCDLNCTKKCSKCFSKDNCTECNEGFYGKTCTDACPSGCDGNCSLIDGRCFGCKPGFLGEYCDKICENGTYGVNCSQRCHNVDINCQECITHESGNFANCTQCSSGYYPVTAFTASHNICIRCSNNCIDTACDNKGFCTKGCLNSKWGDRCNIDCKRNCVECDQNDGTCLECTTDTYSDNCSQNCSSYCNRTENGRVCENNTGSCLQGCESMTRYGEYCDNQCNSTCINQSCEWKTGHCLEGCEIDYYGSFCGNRCADTCQSNEKNRKCDEVNGHCLFRCINGFHGSRCDSQCSSQCINTTCNQETAECLHGCIDGYERLKCVQAITGADSEEKKSLVIIAGSTGAGVAVIVLLVILVICLIKRNRRQKLSSNTKCEENDYELDMKEIPKQTDEPGAIYAKPFKPKQEAGGDVGREYDTAYDGDQKIPAIDNGYTAVNIETSANEKSKRFEVCDIAHDNKPLSGNNDYAMVNKEKSTVKENECFEEVYDTTHDNKKYKQLLSSNNDYAVLSVRSDNIKGFGKSNLAQPDDVYDSTEGRKHKNMSHQSNEYAVFNPNNGNKHGHDKAYTLYDTATDKKMRPGNNDYDFCEQDTD